LLYYDTHRVEIFAEVPAESNKEEEVP